MSADLGRRLLAEAVGTAFLLIAAVGSGIAAQSLSPGDTGLQLLESAVATGAALAALILALGPVSGAHLNPAVTIADRCFGGISTGAATGYVAAQVFGGLGGVVVANLMFGEPAAVWSSQVRSGGGLWLGEAVATVGLLLVIFGIVRSGRTQAVAGAVGAYIAGAYFFTSSTSFANPAVAVARTITDTFAGIEPSSAPAFVAFELMGTAVAVAVIRVLYPSIGKVAAEVVVPRQPVEAQP